MILALILNYVGMVLEWFWDDGAIYRYNIDWKELPGDLAQVSTLGRQLFDPARLGPGIPGVELHLSGAHLAGVTNHVQADSQTPYQTHLNMIPTSFQYHLKTNTIIIQTCSPNQINNNQIFSNSFQIISNKTPTLGPAPPPLRTKSRNASNICAFHWAWKKIQHWLLWPSLTYRSCWPITLENTVKLVRNIIK